MSNGDAEIEWLKKRRDRFLGIWLIIVPRLWGIKVNDLLQLLFLFSCLFQSTYGIKVVESRI